MVSKSGFDLMDSVKSGEEFFLKSSRRELMSLYQISSDNPQKDNFNNHILGIDKMVISGIVNPTIVINSVFPEGVVDRDRPFKILLLFNKNFPSES